MMPWHMRHWFLIGESGCEALNGGMARSRIRSILSGIILPVSAFLSVSAGEIPREPVEIGFEPQYFVDDYLVDNRWGNKQKREMVLRRFHSATKEPVNPVIAGDGGYVTVKRDAESGSFQLWYQKSHSVRGEDGKVKQSLYGVAYAESEDGIRWERPRLGLYDWLGSKENNVVWKGLSGKRASGPQILSLPERDKRGFRYVMGYRSSGNDPEDGGIRLIGSQDGIHWDRESDTFLTLLHSDTLNSIVHDPASGEYVMFCRAKDRYRRRGEEMIDLGASRRVARLGAKKLWGEWEGIPQSILTPDSADAEDHFNAFYGMPVKVHAGIFWGSLWVFRFNDHIYSELATSRDGFDFDRAVQRVPLIELGEEGSWDSYMIFASPDWVEVEDEWWIYYAGWDGPHGTPERTPGIGLARIRKGGFASLRGPNGGGGVVTRLLRWPGGDLVVNADASEGEINVRISDAKRNPIPGFDYSDREAESLDEVGHVVRWGGRSLEECEGDVIRIEFSLRNADLFGFSARKN